MPGYACYRGAGDNMHRGGCALFIRNRLRSQIVKIDTPGTDCIFLKLKPLPHVTFMGCYIPPSDSPYHSLEPLSELAERLKSPDEKFILMGDLNARFGPDREAFIASKGLPASTTYVQAADSITLPNANARYIIGMLAPRLVLLNGLMHGTHIFPSDLTFRRRNIWISELDICLISPECLPIIKNMSINQRLDLPSDHAPISCQISMQDAQLVDCTNLSTLTHRANELGRAPAETTRENNRYHRKPIRMTEINQPQARAAFRETEPPPLVPFDADAISESMNTIVYDIASHCRTQEPDSITSGRPNSNNRWKQLLEDDDTRALWKAIQWNGTIASNDPTNTPCDEAFKEHFEKLLNPPQRAQQNEEQPDTPPVYLPVTDDPIQPEEVSRATQKVKANKSGGPSGVPPGLLKIMPTRWLTYLAMLFSLILSSSTYPRLWSISKLVVLFKKGPGNSCDNYRGISLMDTFAKLFDSILNKRLEQWFQPDREQAGSQRGRGCVEHLLTLRLLMDFASYKKKKMFVVFVDFSKAYDRVPRHLLLRRLQAFGCGATMIKIISAMYNHTSMMLRSAMISTSIGVRQGSPTSCFLFTLLHGWSHGHEPASGPHHQGLFLPSPLHQPDTKAPG